MANMTQLTPAQSLLAAAIRAVGPVRTARVSSAQARGAAKRYPYWGAVRYEIRARKSDGIPVNVATERASSDRRSMRLAKADCDRIEASESRIYLKRIGAVADADAQRIVSWLATAGLRP